MEQINNILESREHKAFYIKQFLNVYQVITLKANIVGINKNIKEAYILLSYFDKLISSYSFKKYVFDDYDGPMVLYLCSKEKSLKETMVLYEQYDELGRFVDIDVYYNEEKSLNRNNLRKCYLCDKPAFVCGREKTHSVEQLNNYLKDKTIIQVLNIINKLCDESIMSELNLHPKFGLVTPYSKGSHQDMDYNLMIKAKESIIPYFKKMFLEGYNNNNINDIFQNIRNIGIIAEQDMFSQTNGINAYKGLIFALGLVVTAVAIKLSNLKENKSIFDYIKEMTQGITEELNNGNDTFGKIAFQEYNIKGARYEAELGFPNVIKIINTFDLETDQSKTEALCNLIFNIDDTVLLKRCKDINMYKNIKNKFNNLKYDTNTVNELTKYCIDNNLSFGGSADLLIVSIFIKMINEVFKLDLFEE